MLTLKNVGLVSFGYLNKIVLTPYQRGHSMCLIKRKNLVVK